MNEAKVFPLEDVLIALRVRPDTATSYGVTMLGPLVKAQLVAFLTKKLLESPTFVGGVQALHGSVTRIQQGAYDTLLQATEEYDRKDPSHHLKDQATATTHRPRADESPREQNKELLAFIERTKRELEKEQNGKR